MEAVNPMLTCVAIAILSTYAAIWLILLVDFILTSAVLGKEPDNGWLAERLSKIWIFQKFIQNVPPPTKIIQVVITRLLQLLVTLFSLCLTGVVLVLILPVFVIGELLKIFRQ